MTAGETAQVEANMSIVHNIMNNSNDVIAGGSTSGNKLQLAA